jgi:hypothetical protein
MISHRAASSAGQRHAQAAGARPVSLAVLDLAGQILAAGGTAAARVADRRALPCVAKIGRPRIPAHCDASPACGTIGTYIDGVGHASGVAADAACRGVPTGAEEVPGGGGDPD